jgi:hypothetical protein
MDGQIFAIDREHNGADAPKRGAAAAARPVVEAESAGGRQDRPASGVPARGAWRESFRLRTGAAPAIRRAVVVTAKARRPARHLSALRLANRHVMPRGFNAHACHNPDRAWAFSRARGDLAARPSVAGRTQVHSATRHSGNGNGPEIPGRRAFAK